jgi:hypothetical protein
MMMPDGERYPGEEILDESLRRLARTGPEFGGGLSNHGPMAAEAMLRLGRAGAVEPWLTGYLLELDETRQLTGPVTDQNWREALGDLRRVTDWELYLREELAEAPWREVLARWWARLIPGLSATALHGIIRTSHGARSLAVMDSPERIAELARGLAYWAANYRELPDPPRARGQLDLAAAVGGLPVAARRPGRGLIDAQIQAGLAGEHRFPAAVGALRPPADVPADLLALASAFTRIFLVYGRNQPIGFLHAVTAPVAARSVLPLLPAGMAQPSYDALWRIDAAIYAVYAAGAAAEAVPAGEPPTPGDLTDRAVGTGDVHAIKLTEACLRLHAESPDPMFLHAAARASELLG